MTLYGGNLQPCHVFLWFEIPAIKKVSASHSCDEQINATVLPQSTGSSITTSIHVTNDTHLGLANNAVSSNRLKPFGNGTWIVMEADGVTPHSVKLHPKPSCSCVATRICFHITACRMMAGLPLEYSGERMILKVIFKLLLCNFQCELISRCKCYKDSH